MPITVKEIEEKEQQLLDTLPPDDAYLVRKYSNQQNREIVREVIRRRPDQKELINDVYFSWTEFFTK
jgi:hypothetical protein